MFTRINFIAKPSYVIVVDSDLQRIDGGHRGSVYIPAVHAADISPGWIRQDSDREFFNTSPH
jgi:hypothetical protein